MDSPRIIDLDMYGEEFRRGYDASSVTFAMKECVRHLKETGKQPTIFVKIHKDSLPICQGICAENMINTIEADKLPIDPGVILEPEETWLKMSPSMKFWG